MFGEPSPVGGCEPVAGDESSVDAPPPRCCCVVGELGAERRAFEGIGEAIDVGGAVTEVEDDPVTGAASNLAGRCCCCCRREPLASNPVMGAEPALLLATPAAYEDATAAEGTPLGAAVVDGGSALPPPLPAVVLVAV